MLKFQYKVLIPCAGLGSRLKNISSHINKGLVTVGLKPALSYIIDKIPEDVEIVVPLGYKGEQIREFLTIAYPNRNFIFETVFPYQGEGSGMGVSMLTVKKHLQCPFILIGNDTIIEEDLPQPINNWIGWSMVESAKEYKVLNIDQNNNVVSILNKGLSGKQKAFIACAGIKDYELFWKGIKDEKDLSKGDIAGFTYLKDIKPIQFTWYDTGNINSLEQTRNIFTRPHNISVLDKENEAIWFINNKVIKFHTDKSFIRDRIIRATYLQKFVPPIEAHGENMFRMPLIGDGTCLSKNNNISLFKEFLEWVQSLWNIPVIKPVNWKQLCLDFYKTKTEQRIKLLLDKYNLIDQTEIINGTSVPAIKDLLNSINWNNICDSEPSMFHGDLHFENILLTNNSKEKFLLVDWRHNFSGIIQCGDKYYDLAKLRYGMIISHDLMEQNLFSIQKTENNIYFDFLRKNENCIIIDFFDKWCKEKNYDLQKIKIITSLNLINSSALHQYPYCLMLYYAGKMMLYNELKKGTNNE